MPQLLARAHADSTRQGLRDSLLLACHLSLAALPNPIRLADYETLRGLERHNVHVAAFDSEGDQVFWCYAGSLLETIRGDGDLHDLAFLGLQELGWETSCFCGNDSFPGPEQFHTVIDRGESFLREHTRSHIGNAVAWTVAMAHETAWSIMRAATSPGDDRGALAEYHRKRAIDLYSELLGATVELSSAVRESTAVTLKFLQDDRDTHQRTFWCFWD